MKLARFSALACLLPFGGACSSPNVHEVPGSSSQAILNGLPSTSEENFVVSVNGAGVCTGTMVAPNVVLTALHCLSEFDSLAQFRCEYDGSLTSLTEGGGEFGETVDPNNIQIRVGTAPAMQEAAARGIRIFSSGSNTICRDDIGLVVLDTPLDLEPQKVRLGAPVMRGESMTLIGYGVNESGTAGQRHRLVGTHVTDVGEYDSYPKSPRASPHTFVMGVGPCSGDSGGPAFSDETGAVIGIFSILVGNDCEAADARNVLTQVGPFENLIREALAFAGAEPLTEVEDPGTGEGGAGGADPGPAAGAGEAGQGTSATGGSSTGEGGEGSTATGGSGIGEGGDGADGTGATQSTGGRAGTTSSGAARAGTEPFEGEGSGSRGDASCACRLEGTPANRTLGWAGFLSLLVVAALRRRAR
jgi:MYXO-CTERM domain-containing protein